MVIGYMQIERFLVGKRYAAFAIYRGVDVVVQVFFEKGEFYKCFSAFGTGKSLFLRIKVGGHNLHRVEFWMILHESVLIAWNVVLLNENSVEIL